jgi:hypothetical protein
MFSPFPVDDTILHLLQPDVEAHAEPHPFALFTEHVVALVGSDPDTPNHSQLSTAPCHPSCFAFSLFVMSFFKCLISAGQQPPTAQLAFAISFHFQVVFVGNINPVANQPIVALTQPHPVVLLAWPTAASHKPNSHIALQKERVQTTLPPCQGGQ